MFNPGRATANWDTMELFALTDDSGTPATLTLGGVTTFRITFQPDSHQDHDYFMFIPVGDGPVESEITITDNGDGTITLEWTDGILVSASNVKGPYAPVADATSPLTLQATEVQQYFQVEMQQ